MGNRKSLETWNLETLKLWNSATLELWNSGTPEYVAIVLNPLAGNLLVFDLPSYCPSSPNGGNGETFKISNHKSKFTNHKYQTTNPARKAQIEINNR